jgi:hypothetical protein
MLATAIALGVIPVGSVEPQLFRSPAAIALYAVIAVICLWPLVNRFLARRPRPALQVHRGPIHTLMELADELAVDAAPCPSPSLSSPSQKAGPGPTTATSAPRRHPTTADRGELAVGSRLWCRRRPRPGIWTTALSHRTDWRELVETTHNGPLNGLRVLTWELCTRRRSPPCCSATMAPR